MQKHTKALHTECTCYALDASDAFEFHTLCLIVEQALKAFRRAQCFDV